jgi:hypothetical protein
MDPAPMPPPKLVPALMGGLFLGILSVLPYVGAVNGCCCLWVVLGGVLAAWTMQQNHPAQITLLDGALVGFLAGAIGFIVMMLASVPLSLMQGDLMEGFTEGFRRSQETMTPDVREMMDQLGPGVIIVMAAAVMFGASLVFATIGGLVGAAIFRRSAPPPSAPPPPVPAFPPSWMPPPPPPAADPQPRAGGEESGPSRAGPVDLRKSDE